MANESLTRELRPQMTHKHTRVMGFALERNSQNGSVKPKWLILYPFKIG